MYILMDEINQIKRKLGTAPETINKSTQDGAKGKHVLAKKFSSAAPKNVKEREGEGEQVKTSKCKI